MVFAKARCALEAMAVGTAVVLCDELGMGPLVTSQDFDRLRSFNFGVRTLREPVTQDGIVREISRYDHSDAAEVCRKLRSSASVETAVDAILDVYEEVIAEWRQSRPADSDHELRAAAAYLRTLGPEQNFRAHTHGLLRELYFRVRAGRPVAPDSAVARAGETRERLYSSQVIGPCHSIRRRSGEPGIRPGRHRSGLPPAAPASIHD